MQRRVTGLTGFELLAFIPKCKTFSFPSSATFWYVVRTRGNLNHEDSLNSSTPNSHN